MPSRNKRKLVNKNNCPVNGDVDNADENLLCLLCSKGPDEDNLAIGPVYQKGDVRGHRNCLYFGSTLLEQETDDWTNRPADNFFFFTPESVKREVKRSSRVRCAFCKQMNAAAKCHGKGCRMNYHFSCGLANKVMFNFREFVSLCQKHQPRQKPPNSVFRRDPVCDVCQEDVLPRVGYDQIFCPSCKRWFHRTCIQTWAYNAGAFHLRCPVCNNVDDFKEELLNFGFELPIRDAEWEVAYADIYREQEIGVFVRCSALQCICVHGRDFSADSGHDEMIICAVCGSNDGIHRGCIDVWNSSEPWECDTCERTTLTLEAQAFVSQLYRQRMTARATSKQKQQKIAPKIIDDDLPEICDDLPEIDNNNDLPEIDNNDDLPEISAPAKITPPIYKNRSAEANKKARNSLSRELASMTTKRSNNNVLLPLTVQRRFMPVPVLVKSIIID